MLWYYLQLFFKSVINMKFKKQGTTLANNKPE
jgi:hypothetical protein